MAWRSSLNEPNGGLVESGRIMLNLSFVERR
jgi:hypothetical protein